MAVMGEILREGWRSARVVSGSSAMGRRTAARQSKTRHVRVCAYNNIIRLLQMVKNLCTAFLFCLSFSTYIFIYTDIHVLYYVIRCIVYVCVV